MRQLLPEPGRLLADRVAIEDAYAPPAGGWLRVNFVVSLDGAVEIDGGSEGLSGPVDMEVFAALRGLADVVLVGASTARSQQYGPAKVAPEVIKRRLARGQAPVPPIAVVTASGALDPGGVLFSREERRGIVPPRPLVLTADAAPAERRIRLAEVADVVVCGSERVEPAVAVAELAERGLRHVVCEGGPTLLTSLLAGGVVDELCLTHAPVLVGPGHRTLLAPTPALGSQTVSLEQAVSWEQAVPWELSFLGEGGGLLFGRYRRAAPQGR